jgi:hypothetical protein
VNILLAVELGICLSRTTALAFSAVLSYPSGYPNPKQQPMAAEGEIKKQPAESELPENISVAEN